MPYSRSLERFSRFLLSLCYLVILSCQSFASDKAFELQLPAISAAWAKENPPVIDGCFEDDIWNRAQPASVFWQYDKSARHDDLAWAKVAYDEQAIYIAFHISNPSGYSLTEGETHRDGGTWGNPNVQVFVQPHGVSDYYDFMVNSINTQRDSKNHDVGWDSQWVSAVNVAQNGSYWQLEMALPYAIFETSLITGFQWRINLTCTVAKSEGRSGWLLLTWAPAFKNYHNPSAFGFLDLKKVDWPSKQYSFNASVGASEPGFFTIGTQALSACNTTADYAVTIISQSPDAQESTQEATLRLPDPNPLPGLPPIATTQFSFPITQQGRYKFCVELRRTDSKELIASRVLYAQTPPPAMAYTDRSLYMNQDSASITVVGASPELKDERILVTLENQQGEKQSIRSTSCFDSFLRAQCNIPLLDLDYGHYKVIVEKDDSETSQIITASHLTKAPFQKGSVWYNDRGVLYCDETPIYPFGMFYIQNHLGTNNLLEEYAQAGFNTIVWEWTDIAGYQNALKLLEPYGVMLLPSLQNEVRIHELLGRAAVEQTLDNRITDIVRGVSQQRPGHQLAWYLWDEPHLDIIPRLQRWNSLVKDNDPYHPTLLCIAFPSFYGHFAPAADIIAPDPYPGFPNGPLEMVHRSVGQARKAVHGRKPIIAILQAFSEPQGDPSAPLPSPDELRCMTYLAIAQQARGIIYFSYSFNGAMRESHPQLWAEACSIAGEIRDLTSVLACDSGDADAELLDPTCSIKTRVIQHRGTFYLLAVNPNREPLEKISWKLVGFNADRLELYGQNRSVSINQGVLTDTFAPMAVHLYRTPMNR